MVAEISVIIPAYNAAATIERTLRSVLASTVPVDVVVVNDGSTDGTKEVAESVKRTVDSSKVKSSIRIITQPNAGCYTARLTGLSVVKTKFVSLIDADDTVDPQMYEKMLAFAKKCHLDIVECDYEGKPAASVAQEVFDTPELIREKVIVPRFAKGEGTVQVWDKLYRMEVLELPFDSSNIMMFEDGVFNLQAFLHARRIGYLHEKLYHYIINDGSSVRNFRLKNVSDLKEMIRFRREYLPRFGIEDETLTYCWICKNVRNMYIVACSAPIRDGVPRMEKVWALLDLPEVVDAFEKCGQLGKLMMMRRRLVVSAVGTMKGAQSLLYKLIGR